MMKNIAVILSGGKGTRLGYSKPKQFIKVAGKLIIEHTIEVFERHPNIDEIAIVCHQDYIGTIEELVVENLYKKVKKILNGGKERYDSSLSAIAAYEGENVNLIFHDAVRPLVSNRIISDTIVALKKYNAVDVAIPATDTIINTEGDFILSIPDRNKLKSGQTPQGFRIETIKKAYEIALKDKDFKATDDCGIVIKYLPNEKVYVVKGDESNIKLTYEEDLFLMDKLFQLRSIEMVDDGIALDKLKDKVIAVYGGSYGIGKDIVDIAKRYNAKVYSFSRSANGVDVSNVNSVKNSLQQIVDGEGKIDFIVNTAGVLDKESLVQMDYNTIHKAIEINYMGNVILAKESFEYLSESKGALLFFTSSSYTRGRAMYSTYSSLKAAVVNFTQAIASEWENFGIRVNCINPERTLTPMRIKSFGQEDPKTLLKSEDVATVSLKTLLIDISGQVIDVKKEKNN